MTGAARAAIAAALAVAGGAALGYSPADVSSGERTYEKACASCHGADLRGGEVPARFGGLAGTPVPALGGPGRFPGLFSALQVFNYARTEMPFQAKGTLTTAEYLHVTTHLAHANGLGQPGTLPVTEEELGEIQVQPLQPRPR